MKNEEFRVEKFETMASEYPKDRDIASLVEQFPEIHARIISWIRDAIRDRAWRRVDKFVLVAAAVKAEGLGDVLVEILCSDIEQVNREDYVCILGDLREVDAVDCLTNLAERTILTDGPSYWLIQKIIGSLGDIGTHDAREYLLAMTKEPWPKVLRWHAAVELQIEDELGFDEDEMLGWSE